MELTTRRMEPSEGKGTRGKATKEKGSAFDLSSLLDTYPVLPEFILEMSQTKGNGKNKKDSTPQSIKFKELHSLFLAKCEELGVRPDDYPFSAVARGEQDLRLFCKGIETSRSIDTAGDRFYAGRIATTLSQTSTGEGDPYRIYRRWLFIVDRIDAHLEIRIPLPNGTYMTWPCPRSWLMRIVDEEDCAIVAATVVFRPTPTKEDVDRLFKRAIVPRERATLTLPGLSYSNSAGWPGEIPELQWAVPDEIVFDTAWYLLASYTQETFQQVKVRTANLGGYDQRVSRTILERWLQRIAGRCSTMESGLNDPRRKAWETPVTPYKILLNESEESLEATVAELNGEMLHRNGFLLRSPLETLREKVRRGCITRKIAESDRKPIPFPTVRQTVAVRGNVSRGKYPHVMFKHAEYSSDALRSAPHLIGTNLEIECDYDDMRIVRAFLPSGDLLGDLHATGHWAEWKHSLVIRRAITELQRQRRIPALNDPVVAYHRYLEQANFERSLREVISTLRLNARSHKSDSDKNQLGKRGARS